MIKVGDEAFLERCKKVEEEVDKKIEKILAPLGKMARTPEQNFVPLGTPIGIVDENGRTVAVCKLSLRFRKEDANGNTVQK